MKARDVIFAMVEALPREIRGEIAYAVMCYEHGARCELSREAGMAFSVIKTQLTKQKKVSKIRSRAITASRWINTRQPKENQQDINVLYYKSVQNQENAQQVKENQSITSDLYYKIKKTQEVNDFQPLTDVLYYKSVQKEKEKEEEKEIFPLTPFIEKEKEKEKERGTVCINTHIKFGEIEKIEEAGNDPSNPDELDPELLHKKRSIMPRPSLDEVQAYIDKMGYTFDAEQFIAFYESNGWKVGKNPMKSWQAACRTWQGSKPKRKTGGLPASLDPIEWQHFDAWRTKNVPALIVTPDDYLELRAAVHRKTAVLAQILAAIARMPHVDSVVAEAKRLTNQQPYINDIWTN